MKPATLFLIVPVLILAALFSVANRSEVIVRLDPFDRTDAALSVAMPLYLLVFAAMFAGILLGGATIILGRQRSRARRIGTKEIGEAIMENKTADPGNTT